MGLLQRVLSAHPAFLLAPAATAAIALGLIETQATPSAAPAPNDEFFKTSDNCLACHNGLTTSAGEDVSIGSSWRASMMANSSRDPYWQASVRRETIDHPAAAAAIQDECATCHMPTSRTEAHAKGGEGTVFAHLPVRTGATRDDGLAHDRVSCTMCHQITERNLGTPSSFTGGYVVNAPSAEPRAMFGPFQIEKGLSTIMRSSTDYQPTEAAHVRQSELCATCHTLITKARGPKGEVIGELPEQVVFLEWQHSAYVKDRRTCQSCHMPVVEEDTPIVSVLGAPRKGFARHTFVGGNFFMLRLLNRYRNELGVVALPYELEAGARRAIANLQTSTASVSIERAEVLNVRLNIDVSVQNLTGHKMPTGYPSRRAWIHLTVRDRSGTTIFESGAITPSGLIQGNDNDIDGAKVEPHYTKIRQADQVQIYESVMSDAAGLPTTGLLKAVGYLKDNRLLPRGFDKATAGARIATVGGAVGDADFTERVDRLRYSIEAAGAGPFQIDAELRFQVIGFRWAENLRSYDSMETRRFSGYYDAMAASSSEVISKNSVTSRQ